MATEDQPVRAPRHRPLRIEQSPLERARLWVEILAFVAAGIWAVYTFIYQTNIAPLFEPAHELVTGDVTRIGATPTTYIERVQLTLANDGHVGVDTAAVAINLLGLRDVAKDTKAIKDANHWDILGTHSELDSAAVGGQPHSHIILNPGDSVRIQFLAAVPRNNYSALELDADTVYVRYPGSPKLDIEVQRAANGAVSLHETGPGNGLGVDWKWYFSL